MCTPCIIPTTCQYGEVGLLWLCYVIKHDCFEEKEIGWVWPDLITWALQKQSFPWLVVEVGEMNSGLPRKEQISTLWAVNRMGWLLGAKTDLCPVPSRKMRTSILQPQRTFLLTQMGLEADFPQDPPEKNTIWLLSAPWDLSRELSHAVLEFWPTELWDSKWALF